MQPWRVGCLISGGVGFGLIFLEKVMIGIHDFFLGGERVELGCFVLFSVLKMLFEY